MSGFRKQNKSNCGSVGFSSEGSPRKLAPFWNSGRNNGSDSTPASTAFQSAD